MSIQQKSNITSLDIIEVAGFVSASFFKRDDFNKLEVHYYLGLNSQTKLLYY